MKRVPVIVFLLLLSAAAAPAAKSRSAEEKQAALTAGLAALEDEHYVIAEKEFERYLRMARKRDEKAQGTLLRARALFGQGKYEEAIHLLKSRVLLMAGSSSADGRIYWSDSWATGWSR